MTTTNEQAAKLPIVKRIVIALRSGSGQGISAVLIVLLVVLIAVGCVGGFVGGVLIATRHMHAVQQKLIADTRQTHLALTKALADKADAEKRLADQTDQMTAQTADMQVLKDQVAKDKIEHDAMQKVLADIHDNLQAPARDTADAKPEKAVKPPDGAKVKFGGKECQLSNGGVSSKQDVKCLNLRDAINGMNGAAAASAKDAKPTK